MDPNEGGEYTGLDRGNERSVVQYLLRRREVLTGEKVRDFHSP